MKELINQALQRGIDIYQNTQAKPAKYYCLDLDCSDLPLSEGILPDTVKDTFFRSLHEDDTDLDSINKKACLYHFEILEPTPEIVLEAYRRFKANKDLRHRASSALKKYPPLNNTLYVGKVKSDIGGRMVVHFGYYHTDATSGLQLNYWAREIGLKLKVHIYAFSPVTGDFINPLEPILAKELKPLIGKSR